jgi:putative ABC transport system ATP-binding protein
MSEPVIRLESVTKVYGAGEAATRAVSEVSLALPRASWTAIMGPSGHGKTTLLQLMGGLDRPTAGKIFLDGQELSRLPNGALARLRGRRLGFVFQFFNLLPHLTALENVQAALWLGGKNGVAARARAMELLAHVGLADKAEHFPGMLSGGQQQRVAIARALANEPEVLLMDEPTGNLDSAAEAEFLALLGELHRDGKTLVVVTHNPAVADRAQRIVRVRDGRIEQDG